MAYCYSEIWTYQHWGLFLEYSRGKGWHCLDLMNLITKMDNSSSVAVTCEGQAELCCCWMMFCCVTTVYSQVVYRRTYASVPWRSNRRLSLGAERARLDSRPAPPLGPQLIMCWSCWAALGRDMCTFWGWVLLIYIHFIYHQSCQ